MASKFKQHHLALLCQICSCAWFCPKAVINLEFLFFIPVVVGLAPVQAQLLHLAPLPLDQAVEPGLRQVHLLDPMPGLGLAQVGVATADTEGK